MLIRRTHTFRSTLSLSALSFACLAMAGGAWAQQMEDMDPHGRPGMAEHDAEHDHAEHAEHEHDEHAMSEEAHINFWEDVDMLICVLEPTEGNDVQGTITFEQMEDGVKVTGHLTGLEPDSMHGFHVHQFGDTRAEDGTSAGGHYNPEGHDHALPEGEGERHAGDMGNIQADENGNAQFEKTFDNISLVGAVNPIIGRGLIVHAAPDDGGQPTGNAGARIAMGVIGIANPER